MHIAVNTRLLIPGKMEGIGYFTYESMKRLTRQHPEHRFTFIFDRPHDPSFIFSDNVQPVSISPPARHPFLWYLWQEWSLPSLFRKINPDIFIATDGYLSLSTNVKSLAVIHDLNFEKYPEDLPYFNRKFYRHYFPKYAKKAARIASVSGFTKSDIVNLYHIDENKIDVVYNGVNEDFLPVSEEIKIATRKKYSDGNPYFLFVGALHKRKNIANLMRSYDEFRKKISSPVKLLLAGKKRWWNDEMENVYQSMQFRNDVIFTGWIPESDLINITASAFSSVYVSTFEGFGIPIVEAMRSGVPVITSNVTSMPEVSGDAAILCDPFSTSSICDAMVRLFSDNNLRLTCIERGLKRQQNFSWQKTADELWKSIEKCMVS